MNEFELIGTWFTNHNIARSDVHLGIGDDAALITLGRNQELVTASACSVAAHSDTPEQIASQCYDQALEALLKQQATPAWAVLCLCLEQVDPDWLHCFSTRLYDCLRSHSVQLIGGDTTHGPTQATLFLSGYRSRPAI